MKNQILNQSYLNDLVFNDMLQRTFGFDVKEKHEVSAIQMKWLVHELVA